MPPPLNPFLYERLKKEFRHVVIAHPGISASFDYSQHVIKNRLELHFQSAGEYYRVNCPHCGDSRKRLWINHLWGTHDDVVGGVRAFLAVCYNEDCLSVPGRPMELYDRIYGFRNANIRDVAPIVILQGETESQTLKEITLPGITLRLDRIPPNDKVSNYLRDRGFDHVMLGKDFDISYCLDAPSEYHAAYGRIVIPVYMRGVLVGWQCRYVGDLDWKATGIPKYYNLPNMPRRLMLYNFDNARNHPYVVITEGAFDVWGVGTAGVATFGKDLSAMQLQLICENWEGGAIIVLLDGDAWESSQKLANRFRQEQYKGVVIPVQLPDGTDPGGLARSFIWECIEDECHKNGIDLMTLSRNDGNANTSGSRRSYRAPRSDDKRGRDVGTQPPVPNDSPKYDWDAPRRT